MMAYASTATFCWAPRPSSLPRRAVGIRHLAQPRLMERKVPDQAVPNPLELNALLIRVAQLRDRTAFQKLFVYFAPRLKAYLMRQGASAQVAEDLAQEAMLVLWRKAVLFDPGKAGATTWMFTIARNLRIDAIRREKRPEIDPNDPALVPDDDPAADDEIVRAETDARLREALTVLPREQIEVVEMSFFADKPHSVIAKELGLPLGTVKSRLRLAMGRLRNALGEKT
jgi:RNA polymerase sigma-70 factor (ECF subfamily)